MGDLVDLLFGSTDDSAQRATTQQNQQIFDLFERNQEQARADALGLFPLADINRNLGFQGALDVFGSGIGQAADVFQQGNVGAQQATLAGLPQIHNAILGQPVDLSGLQAQSLSFDPSFLSQTLPEFQTQALAGGGGAVPDSGDPLANLFAGFPDLQANQTRVSRNAAGRALGFQTPQGTFASVPGQQGQFFNTAGFQGDVANVPGNQGTVDLSTLSIADLQQGLQQAQMVGFGPMMGIPMAISTAMLNAELSSRGGGQAAEFSGGTGTEFGGAVSGGR